MVVSLIEKNRFLQVGTLAFVTVTLSACLGGDSSDGGSSESGVIATAEKINITEENYLELAKMAFSVISVPSSEPSLPASVVSQSLVSMAVSLADCDSGSGIEEIYFKNPPYISNGDAYDNRYDNCKKNYLAGYSLSDGRTKVEFKNISGIYLQGEKGTYGVDSLYENWLTGSQQAERSFSVMFDGDIVYDAERTESVNRWKQESKRLYIETKTNGVVQFSQLLTDSVREWTDDLLESTYTLKGSANLVLGAPVWGIFDIRVHEYLTGMLGRDGREAPSGGKITLFDNRSDAVVTVKPDGSDAVIEFDLEGDGIPELTDRMNIADSLLKEEES